MREVVGRQGLVNRTVEDVCRCCRGRRGPRRQRFKAFRCIAYRTDPQDVHATQPEAEQGHSRLLADRKSLLQSRKQPRASRLIRRTDPAPQSEAPSDTCKPPSRLLQRSQSIKTSTQGLTRSTDTLRKTRGASDKASKLPKQANDRVRQRSKNGAANKRFSQEAGKLSRKDWQVAHAFQAA